MTISRRDLIKTGAGAACAMAVGANAVETQAEQSASTQPAKPADRMPEIPADKMTPEQKKAADDFLAERKVPVFGPFVPLLRSPEVMLRAKSMGDYLRYKSVLSAPLNEFAILITARHWSQEYEWALHQPIAVKAGLKAEITQALAEGRRPQGMSSDEEMVYEFCTELHQNQSVSDATYARVQTRFGEQGIIDLTSVNGYYTFLAMVLNATRTAVPKSPAPPLPAFPH
ncbi:MAG TPA: twin-arginine translocation signal domain-containing protein [Candidatus Angelobacter sp.]|jgi:4-carboxymuconolactone decarboxylase|nr:twin-arginine translocation signal domain-containing protein [Candidatus Angelobacter sp.]